MPNDRPLARLVTTECAARCIAALLLFAAVFAMPRPALAIDEWSCSTQPPPGGAATEIEVSAEILVGSGTTIPVSMVDGAACAVRADATSTVRCLGDRAIVTLARGVSDVGIGVDVLGTSAVFVRRAIAPTGRRCRLRVRLDPVVVPRLFSGDAGTSGWLRYSSDPFERRSVRAYLNELLSAREVASDAHVRTVMAQLDWQAAYSVRWYLSQFWTIRTADVNWAGLPLCLSDGACRAQYESRAGSARLGAAFRDRRFRFVAAGARFDVLISVLAPW
jgi:hypothetical protein